ncbi:MAG: hypothetical protein OXG13_13815 [Gemmatimonadaceae bacterium]|nr:hypothetical protein [Gemmatimonadaceae bacterium]
MAPEHQYPLVAVEAFDDRFLGSLGDGTENWESCTTWDACRPSTSTATTPVAGIGSSLAGNDAEEKLDLLNYRPSANVLDADRPGGPVPPLPRSGEWHTTEPYAAGGGAVGHSPATWVLEMKLTPFDDLVYNDESLSRASELYPGKIIGFELRLFDADEEPPFVSSFP